ncbi:MAG: DUF4037 domain-containing protein [Clostridia bacterium]|nr:DUF4037 domain-containing protein [Clostridia bacterium]
MAEHIKGLELSRLYFEEYGRIIEADFPQIKDFLAFGLAGSGSECFGYDDAFSEDHDFEPGFCIFLPDEQTVNRRQAFLLERAYAKLPDEFMGYKRAPVPPVGGNRHGVIRTADFFEARTGFANGPRDAKEWLSVPETALAEAVNGDIFDDRMGEFTAVRSRIKSYPSDVRLKKLAGWLLTCVQAGQYNYPRCVERGQTGGAQLAAFEFVTAIMHVAFLRAGKYMPYYKWAFRALNDIDEELSQTLERLISTPNGSRIGKSKAETIDKLCAQVAAGIAEECAISGKGADNLKFLAYAVNDKISNPDLRNMNIFAGV